MGLFSKKYDYEKDKLQLVFNAESLKYELFLNDELINYQSLNKRTKEYLDKNNHFLETHPYMIEYELSKISQSETIQRSEYLKRIGYSCTSFESLGPNNGTMSSEIESYLTKLTSIDNILLGIYRVGNSPDEYIIDNLLNGILMTGHSGSGTITKPKLSDNVSYYPDNKTIIKELMYANDYKNSKGSILIRIPDTDLESEDIFINNNGEIRINPKYILGYISVSANHHIESIITPQDILKQQRINNNHYNEDAYSDTLYMHR